jgi:Flp pilus assembly protein TadG
VTDRGTVTAFVVTLVAAFVACAALALDGGRLIAARIAAGDHAENAARAAAQELTELRAGARTVEPIRARARAAAYLDQHGVAGEVVVTPASVTVTVVLEHRPTLLGLIGIGPRLVRATRTVWPVSTHDGSAP